MISLSSVQFSHSVMSDSLGPHGLQHARLPYGILKTKFIKSEQIDGYQRGRMGEERDRLGVWD